MKTFRHHFEQYRENTGVEAQCNAITFINKSDGIAYVENYPLQPDETLALEGWAGEQDVSKYQLVFDPLVTTPLVYVIRKIYS